MNLSSTAFAQTKKKKTAKVIPTGTPVLWRDPGDISARDLKYGPGAPDIGPQAPFTFVREATIGASPKFRVKDGRGVTWDVKLGVEGQAETVESGLFGGPQAQKRFVYSFYERYRAKAATSGQK